MALRMWTYDLAREQTPTLDTLRRMCDLSLEAGYNALGLYLEHRFAYPSLPWSHGKGCVTPEMVRTLQEEYRTLQIVPFINLLGHFEGFLYTEQGHALSELKFRGLQACPSKPDFVALANKVLDDTLDIFQGNIIHIGGDETQHLGACPQCAERVKTFEERIGTDGKAKLYAEHFVPLIEKVIDAGRRPAIWGDMLHAHPDAMASIHKATLIFDWQYFQSAGLTSQVFRPQGFDVVYCPAFHTYNATWLHLPQSERNVRENAISAEVDHAYGVCVTTWECGLFGNYETLLPAIRASGEILRKSTEIADSRAARLKTGAPNDLELANASSTMAARDDSSSAANGLADGLIATTMDRRASEVVMMPTVRHLAISTRTDGTVRETARIPIEVGQAVLFRLGMLAGMDPEKRTERRIGRISGSYKQIPFEIDVLSEPTSHGLKFTLSMTPWKGTTAYSVEREAPYFLKAYLQESETYEEWARLMGVELLDAGGTFEFGGIRSSMKCRFLLYSNPFLLWLHHRDEYCGPIGDKALSIFERGVVFAPDASARGVSDFGKSAILFVRFAEEAHKAYADGRPGAAITALTPCRQIFDNLLKIALSNQVRIGGSLADIERCHIGKQHVERVMQRIRQYGDGTLGYLPSFEMITHPNFVPHDQAAWWMINTWARE